MLHLRSRGNVLAVHVAEAVRAIALNRVGSVDMGCPYPRGDLLSQLNRVGSLSTYKCPFFRCLAIRMKIHDGH